MARLFHGKFLHVFRPCLARGRAASSSALQWTSTTASELAAVSAGELSPLPGLVWAHGLGGSVAIDDARGIPALLHASALARRVVRLDTRGHGQSALLHDVGRGTEQYRWPALGEDLRRASRSALPRACFGGEGAGALIALHAAHAALASGAPDAPPGIVLMRPPELFGKTWLTWCAHYEAAALAVEEKVVGRNTPLDHADRRGKLRASSACLAEDGEAVAENLWLSMSAAAYAAALRGQAASSLPDELQRVQCPVLVLAMPGDPEHTVDAARELSDVLPNAQLAVVADIDEAHDEWPELIGSFLARFG